MHDNSFTKTQKSTLWQINHSKIGFRLKWLFLINGINFQFANCERLKKVNGVEVCEYRDLQDVLKAVLKHFGHEVDVIRTCDYE